MNIDDITIGEAKELANMFANASSPMPIDNGMIGKFVIVRCRDAGVHAGFLESQNGRECVLSNARRLWYWKPAKGAAFLSGIAVEGLDKSSKIGAPVRIHLTENCEIIECTATASKSIQGMPSYEK